MDTNNNSQARSAFSLFNMAYLAMPLGSIRIGHSVCMPDGREVPVSDDEFRITQPVRDKDGHWVADALDAQLRERLPSDASPLAPKLRVIPIKFVSDDPALAVRARYEAFNAQGRSICSSNGNGCAMRETGTGSRVEVQCNGSDQCSFAQAAGHSCRLLGRISVQIDGQTNPIGTYVLRTGSINTIRTLETNLRAYHALFGGRLRGVPFNLVLRPMQNKQHNWQTFFVVDLELGVNSLQDALKMAVETSDACKDLDFVAMTRLLMDGRDRGGADDLSAMTDGVDLSEFYPASAFTATHQAMRNDTVDIADPETPVDPVGQVGNVTVLHQRTSQPRRAAVAGGSGAVIEDFDLPEASVAAIDDFAFMAAGADTDVTAMSAGF